MAPVPLITTLESTRRIIRKGFHVNSNLTRDFMPSEMSQMKCGLHGNFPLTLPRRVFRHESQLRRDFDVQPVNSLFFAIQVFEEIRVFFSHALVDKRQSVVVVAHLRLRASALLPFFVFSVCARILGLATRFTHAHSVGLKVRAEKGRTLSQLALGFSFANSVEKTLCKWVILSRSLVAQRRSSRKVLSRRPRLSLMWSIRLVLAQIDCKTGSQSQVSSLGCETSRREDLNDLCSAALRQQRSNLVDQRITRLYLLVSEVVLSAVSSQSLKLSLVCVKTYTLHFSDLSFHFQLTDLHVFDRAPRVLQYFWEHHHSLHGTDQSALETRD